MSLLARAASLVSILAVLAPAAAFAAEDAQVSVRIADLRVKPSSDARTRLKLGSGRNVSVLGKSSDGQWVQIRTEVDRGGDAVRFEGWVFASHLRSSSGRPMGTGAEPKPALETEDVTGASESETATPAGGDWNFGNEGASTTTDVATRSTPEPWEAETKSTPEAEEESSDAGSSSDWDAFE